MRKVNLQTSSEAQDKLIRLALFFIFFVVSLPLMVNYCISGTNVSFYLRLMKEGGAENLFFLIPSLFVRAGIQGESVYKLLLLMINAATTLIAYVCFRGIFGDEIVGLIACREGAVLLMHQLVDGGVNHPGGLLTHTVYIGDNHGDELNTIELGHRLAHQVSRQLARAIDITAGRLDIIRLEILVGFHLIDAGSI